MKDIPFEKSSFPVLAIDDKTNNLKGVGTCTLTRFDDDRLFLVNSAHTLEVWGNNRPIFIALPNGKTIELPFALKTKTETVDKVDIAVTPLLGEFAGYFYDGSIISLQLHDDFPIDQFKNDAKRVIFFGFPSSNSRFDIDLKKHEINAKPMSLTSIEIDKLAEKNIKKFNVDFSIHILAKFSRRKMQDQNRKRKESPFPYGMSGGAVYYAYVEVGELVDILKGIEFVGIGTEYMDNLSILKATKKTAILSFIKEHFHL